MTTDPKSPEAHDVPQTSQPVKTLDPGAGYITIINRYAVAPERAEELVDLLVRATVETMRYLPGFAGATFRMSVDRTQLVNTTQWQNRESIESAGADPKVAALLRKAAQIADAFTPILYEMRQSVAASSA
jgi:quinol monooxygenase YgiN